MLNDPQLRHLFLFFNYQIDSILFWHKLVISHRSFFKIYLLSQVSLAKKSQACNLISMKNRWTFPTGSPIPPQAQPPPPSRLNILKWWDRGLAASTTTHVPNLQSAHFSYLAHSVMLQEPNISDLHNVQAPLIFRWQSTTVPSLDMYCQDTRVNKNNATDLVF